jgi:hypothetical protein
MKVSFYVVGAPDQPLCVCRMEALPRRGEAVRIDWDGWVVENVVHVVRSNDEPTIKVFLEPLP